MDKRVQISVIIVNYNAREYLLLTLESVFRAINALRRQAEVLVIDNASSDGSAEAVVRHYPQAVFIQNTRNAGFAAANNIGLQRAGGEFVLLLNPDTIIPEDLFHLLIEFMNRTPDAGVVGCKILNADGSFSVDSRHSVPSPLTALWKQLGLNRVFPESKRFGQYNLTYLDADKMYPVDAVSGSFMFLRRQVIEEVGLLDEKFFMYCEDLDYCLRSNLLGWKVYYYPGTVIVHYKGGSTKKNTFRYSWNFNQSLYLFYIKHFQSKYSFILHGIVLLGVIVRGILVFLKYAVGSILRSIRHALAGSDYKIKEAIWVGSPANLKKSWEKLIASRCNIIGIITTEPPGTVDRSVTIPILGHVQSITEFISSVDNPELVFDADHLSFKTTIGTMSALSRWKMKYKFLMLGMDVLVGKSA